MFTHWTIFRLHLPFRLKLKESVVEEICSHTSTPKVRKQKCVTHIINANIYLLNAVGCTFKVIITYVQISWTLVIIFKAKLTYPYFPSITHTDSWIHVIISPNAANNLLIITQVPFAVYSNYTYPMGTKRKLTVNFSGPRSSGRLSELQQPFHTAGVFFYVHGGSVRGACQDVQYFILPFQLRLCLEGKVLQLHQHLRTHIHNQMSARLWRIYTRASSEQEQLRSKTQIKEDWILKTHRKLSSCSGPYVERCEDGVSELEQMCDSEITTDKTENFIDFIFSLTFDYE